MEVHKKTRQVPSYSRCLLWTHRGKDSLESRVVSVCKCGDMLAKNVSRFLARTYRAGRLRAVGLLLHCVARDAIQTVHCGAAGRREEAAPVIRDRAARDRAKRRHHHG